MTGNNTRDYKNRYVDKGDYTELGIYNKTGGVVGKVKIDSEDVERCMKYTWCIDCNYVKTLDGPKRVYLHRYITNCNDPNLIVDHRGKYIDSQGRKRNNTLDNRKKNLRVVPERLNNRNLSMNRRNTVGERGISFNKFKNKYEVYMHQNGKKRHIGDYINKEKAKKAIEDYISFMEAQGCQLDIDRAKIRFALSRDKKKGRKSNWNLNYHIQLKELWSDENGNLRCPYCNEILDTTAQTLEHIINIKNGGVTKAGNVLVVCRRCNYSKDYQELIKWYAKQEFFDEERLAKIQDYMKGPDKFIRENVIYIEIMPEKFFIVKTSSGERILSSNRKEAARQIGCHPETVARGLRGDTIKRFREVRYLTDEEMANYLIGQGYEVRHVPQNLLEIIDD